MSSIIFYTGTKKAKNGGEIPLLSNGKPFFSEYNPERDIHFFADTPSVKESGFILIGGLGDGSHIRAVLNVNPNACVMVLERNRETIDFLFSEGICNSELKNNTKILFTTPENLCSDLKNAYIPVLYGTFLYHPVKAWQLFCDESGIGNSIKAAVQDTLHDIAADYATQARFGKLMHVNVLKNLKLLPKTSDGATLFDIPFKTTCTAAVIGAGPSLDESMPLLKKNRNNLYIISTDTAYRSLLKSGIIADMVVTLDGQNTSISHFLGIDSYGSADYSLNTSQDGFPSESQNNSQNDQFCANSLKAASTKTLVAADICANTAAARYLYEKGYRLFFFTTGHPLGTLANSWYKTNHDETGILLPCLDAGCGTVLSAAADIAVKAGFKSILFFGADFAYKSGKPYARGTYLDELYSTIATKVSTAETLFNHLCFRTVLTKTDAGYTTPLLSSYKKHMDSFIRSCPSSFQFVSNCSELEFKADNTLDLSDNAFSSSADGKIKKAFSFDFKKFLSFYLERLHNKDFSVLFTILPFATWLKEKEKNADINDILDKAAELTALQELS